MEQCIGSKSFKNFKGLRDIPTVRTPIHLTFDCRYDEDAERVELDYPRDMAMWAGVGYNIDSVFQWNDGKKKLTAPVKFPPT